MERKVLRSRQTLEAVEESRIQLARLRQEAKYLEGRCTATTPHYGERTGSSGPKGPSGSWAALVDCRKALEEQETALTAQEQQVGKWIELLPRARWRLLLRCRYLEGMDLTDVAEMLEKATGRSFTMSQVYRLHRQALDAAEKLWPMQ